MNSKVREKKVIGSPLDESDPKEKELRGIEPGAQEETNANSGQNQNPGKRAPARNLEPDTAGMNNPKNDEDIPEEKLSQGKGTETKGEDAALIKELIRSRDA